MYLSRLQYYTNKVKHFCVVSQQYYNDFKQCFSGFRLGSLGNMGALRLEAVFVRYISDGVRNSVRTDVLELSPDRNRFIFRTRVVQLALLFLGNPVASLVSAAFKLLMLAPFLNGYFRDSREIVLA